MKLVFCKAVLCKMSDNALWAFHLSEVDVDKIKESLDQFFNLLDKESVQDIFVHFPCDRLDENDTATYGYISQNFKEGRVKKIFHDVTEDCQQFAVVFGFDGNARGVTLNDTQHQLLMHSIWDRLIHFQGRRQHCFTIADNNRRFYRNPKYFFSYPFAKFFTWMVLRKCSKKEI